MPRKMPKPKKQKTSIVLDPALLIRLKHAAVDAAQDISEFIASAVEAYLKKGGRR